ncbi:serine/threonine-protein kinase [Stieleria varia]|uniref:non-specific serine/threonine protein kinase n=1 Tax=Stieleria varia TaxID=2528005 RepID=A0A5C6B905_9BACT|nr:serine/threonine-protein kinase [Stieleria varia]TWU08450.1 Serine/threonine-protein kinase PrkC [Stieleria varia]
MNPQKMNAPNTACMFDRIDEFLNGDLSTSDLASFEQHLETCHVCGDRLAFRAADCEFWEDAKTFLSDNDVPLEPTQETAAACRDDDQGDKDALYDATKLTFLDPTDDPDMLGRFAGYEICGVVGSGGMGVVMKGRDVSLDRFVAIKVLHSSYACQSAPRKRFAREAQAAAAVLHDNVISIYGVDHWNEMPYLVMPYVKGESLQQRIDRAAPLPIDDIVGISLQIARGLAAAHDQGLVHRDIKPANILMPSSVSRVIITDFGLARTADDASLTRSGVLAGTPQYMSPEQARGEAVDGRTDLFSLGSLMYAMACGRPPFRAETPYGVLRKITDEPHRSLTDIREDTPVWLSKIIDRLLQKRPDDRFANAHELADHLEHCLAHLRQPGTIELPILVEHRPAVRKVWPFVAVSLLLGIFGLFVMTGSSPPSTTNPEVTHQSESGASLVESASQTRNETPPELQWEFDDSLLDRLETDLNILLNETVAEE